MCICLPPRLFITSGVMWILYKFYGFIGLIYDKTFSISDIILIIQNCILYVLIINDQ